MHHRAIEGVESMQLHAKGIMGLILAVLSDQHSKDRRLGTANAVQQCAGELFAAHLKANMG
ncbi:hypothetical protein D3C75_1315820 [compost metagenome]